MHNTTKKLQSYHITALEALASSNSSSRVNLAQVCCADEVPITAAYAVVSNVIQDSAV